MLFHRSREPVTVQSRDEEDALGGEWSRTIWTAASKAAAPEPVPEPEPESDPPEPDEEPEEEVSPEPSPRPAKPPARLPAAQIARKKRCPQFRTHKEQQTMIIVLTKPSETDREIAQWLSANPTEAEPGSYPKLMYNVNLPPVIVRDTEHEEAMGEAWRPLNVAPLPDVPTCGAQSNRRLGSGDAGNRQVRRDHHRARRERERGPRRKPRRGSRLLPQRLRNPWTVT